MVAHCCYISPLLPSPHPCPKRGPNFQRSVEVVGVLPSWPKVVCWSLQLMDICGCGEHLLSMTKMQSHEHIPEKVRHPFNLTNTDVN